ncbi:hypothetical protein S40288_09195 [Stachybotrys chartarum IBT 40288]|nr:hypothetical protein S40288_09195 [Stachybotrys chartarum IBT 40288]
MSRRVTRSASRTATNPQPGAPTAEITTATPAVRPSPSPAPSTSDLPIILFPSVPSFETWLTANAATSPGLWLKISKKSCPVPSITYDAALDVALCHGWIDGQRRALDANFFLQRFTPRRKSSSLWSRRNVDKVAKLTAEGRMKPAGVAAVEQAKSDGRWDRAYAGPGQITVPKDFEEALSADAGARLFFEGLGKSARYVFLLRIETAKKPETRAKRIEQYVGMLSQGKTL